jgi:hypothetical protein
MIVCIAGLNRDTIQFSHRAAGAAFRPGVSISRSGAYHYLRLSAVLKNVLLFQFSRSINWHGPCIMKKHQAY